MKNLKIMGVVCALLLLLACRKREIFQEPNMPDFVQQDEYFAIDSASFLPYSVNFLFSSNYEFTSSLSVLNVYLNPSVNLQGKQTISVTQALDKNYQPDFSKAQNITTVFSTHEGQLTFDPPLYFDELWESDQPYLLYMRNSRSYKVAKVAIYKKPEFSSTDAHTAAYLAKVAYLPKEDVFEINFERQIPLKQLTMQGKYYISSVIIADNRMYKFLKQSVQIDAQGQILSDSLPFNPRIRRADFPHVDTLYVRSYLLNLNQNVEADLYNNTLSINDLSIPLK